jgi:hypothetical protein
MNLQAWIYAARKDDDTPEEVLATVRMLGVDLEARLAAGSLAGYRATAVLVDDDFEDQDIERALVEPVTGGTLPAIYLNLTYDLDRHQPVAAELETQLSDAGLVHVLTDPPAGTGLAAFE